MKETWWVSESQLDPRQQEVVALPLEGNFLIFGPPGSGKTNLLLLRAKFLSLSGHVNLKIVLFTRALREFVAAGAKAYGLDQNHVVTSFSFWADLLHQYGVSQPQEDTFEAQRRALIDKVAHLVSEHKLVNLYEAVLLDEAHDFLPEEVELFSAVGERIFAVADRRQKIYRGEAPFFVLDKLADGQIELLHHYRNGFNVCKFADLVARDRQPYDPIAGSSNYDEEHRPSEVLKHHCANLSSEIDLVFSKLEHQLGAYPGEILGVVSPSREAVEEVWQRIEASKYRDVASFQGKGQNLAFDADVRVCVSTLHAAKGLEYRALHVVSCESFRRRPHPRALAFTAITRAKTSLDLYFSGPLLGFLDQAFESLGPKKALPNLSDVFEQE